MSPFAGKTHALTKSQAKRIWLQAHAVILRSPIAHGRIRAIDTAAALARPGVHAVITAADIGSEIPVILLRLDVSPAFKPFEQPVIAHGKVRYVGEPVAVVLADSAAAARNDVLLVEAAGTNLPLSPPRVWEMINGRTNRQAGEITC
jgi:CO/xanthine dehydrogenase Mo-binding subunit